MTIASLLPLLQLTSPALPVGAYSYSEGIEALVDRGQVTTAEALHHWLTQELGCGAIRLEAAVMVRAYRALGMAGGKETIATWNDWLSALRETEELRAQSWQMGRSLLRLLKDLGCSPELIPAESQENWNFAIAFAIAAVHWQIPLETALLGYLYSWASNLVSAGVRLIPLGQTAGQQLLLHLHTDIHRATQTILLLADEDLYACGWGVSLASMAHETQYSRLFRS